MSAETIVYLYLKVGGTTTQLVPKEDVWASASLMERRGREEESREGRTEMGRRTRRKRGGKEERIKRGGRGTRQGHGVNI